MVEGDLVLVRFNELFKARKRGGPHLIREPLPHRPCCGDQAGATRFAVLGLHLTEANAVPKMAAS